MREECYETEMNGKIPKGLPGGFFVYEANDDETILWAGPNVIKLFGCDTFEEFLEVTNGNFKGMVHPDDLYKIENQIEAQTVFTAQRHDYVRYRIITKQGEVKYVEDFGHMLHSEFGESFYYVFIVDVDQNEYFNSSRNSLIWHISTIRFRYSLAHQRCVARMYPLFILIFLTLNFITSEMASKWVMNSFAI